MLRGPAGAGDGCVVVCPGPPMHWAAFSETTLAMTLLRLRDDRRRLLLDGVLRLECWAALLMVPVAWSVSCAV